MFWAFKRCTYRIQQTIMKLIVKNMKIKEPEIIADDDCMERLVQNIKTKELDKVMIVTGKVVMGLGLLDELFDSLKDNNIDYVVYEDVQPNPTIDNVESAYKMYVENKCMGVIAFGGGSNMDCAKIAAARATNQGLNVADMRGLFKIKKQLPPLFAIPTTAGTGSETTMVSVITDPSKHEKYAIIDLKLVPLIAVLDPKLTLSLPPNMTSTTGMDALTHAVEAYIGKAGTNYTDRNAEEAVTSIFTNLEEAFKDGNNIKHRREMIWASYKAGNAFTRASVGYVHAIAHTLGGLYGVPHGLANAIVLPHVLKYYGEHIHEKLAKLSIVSGIGTKDENIESLANKFIANVERMNNNMNIPKGIKELRKEDIPIIVERVLKEGNPDYPVPIIINEYECAEIIEKLGMNREMYS